MLVLLAEAFRAHGRVGHPPHDKQSPQDGQTSVGEEQRLPGLEYFVASNEGEAVGEQAADDLLGAVHHVPVGDGGSLFFPLVPQGR